MTISTSSGVQIKQQTDNAMTSGYVKISRNCPELLGELGGYVWDTKEGEDKPVKVNDHGCDALRYFVKTEHVIRIAEKRRM